MTSTAPVPSQLLELLTVHCPAEVQMFKYSHRVAMTQIRLSTVFAELDEKPPVSRGRLFLPVLPLLQAHSYDR